MTYYGSLTFGAASDTDGDGFTFAQELFRGHSPRAVDSLEPGGVSRRRSATVPMNIGVAGPACGVGSNLAVNITRPPPDFPRKSILPTPLPPFISNGD